MPPPNQTFGPFVHGLNKGGLFEIARTGGLRGAPASNNMASDSLAVRAYVGDFAYQKRNKNWSGADKSFIEFVTRVPPRSGLPPGYAEWAEEQLTDGFLTIQVLRVIDGNGNSIPPAEYIRR